MQRCTLLVIGLLASFAACDLMDGWTHPKGGSRMELLENALDETVKYLEYELDLARDNIETRKDLVKFLKSAQDGMDSTIQHNEAKPKKVESGKDYSDDPIRSGGLNNGASISRRLLENATKTKDGALHMKLKLKPGQEDTVYKFKVDDLKQLAKTAPQEDSPPPRKLPGSLRTGAGSINRPRTGAGSMGPPIKPPIGAGFINRDQGSVGGQDHTIQSHTMFRQALLPNTQAGQIPISNDYGLYDGDQAKTPSSYDDYSQSGRTAAYGEDDNNYPGNDYSDDNGNNYSDDNGNNYGNNYGNDYSDDNGNDYSDDPIQSGKLAEKSSSGSVMEKFKKYSPTKTSDGVLHMKLPQKPGEETVYKFNVNELRQLAKTAHQVDARRR